jgi:DNA helicase II / ATP-dependent DNA helicase PcrA
MTSPDPSTEQRVAATSDQQNTLIIAPPGCGKTEILAHRADHLISRIGRNQRILALTFTNRARANLNERMRQVLGIERMRRYVSVRNFHGHAAEIVRSHYRTIGLDLSEYIPPTTRALPKALRRVTDDRLVASDAIDLLSEIKRRAFSDEQVLDALEQASGRPGQQAALEVEHARQQSNALHYDDLLRHAQCLLSIEGVQRLYRCHYGAVLVDEFQDLSMQQLEIVTHSCSTSHTFAGDPLQGIYTWAGAEPAQVEAVLKAACPEPIQLTESYRSSPRVLTLVNRLGTHLGSPPLSAARAGHWPDDGFGTATIFDDCAAEANEIVSAARLLLERDPGLSIGVITRSKWRRREIDEAFTPSGLPIRRWDIAVDDPRILELVRTAMTQLPRGVDFEEARDAVLDGIDPADVDTIEQVDEVFDHLSNSGLPTPRAALRVLRSSGDPLEAVSAGVHLLNAHTGKGQQFDWVFVVGMEDGHIPDRRNSSDDDLLAEEKRVLLVMLSRARHGLVVSAVRRLSGKYGPYDATPSRWLSPFEAAKPCQWGNFVDHVDTAYPIQPTT